MRGLLGKIAGGVAQGAKGVGGVVFGEAKAALTATSDDESEVELQLQRISDALMPEYRREAVGQLKDLLQDNPKAQLAVGNLGLPVLINVLQEDRDDLDLVRGALECLVAAMALPSHAPDLPANGLGTQEAQAGAVNAELFARRPEHVQLLLNLLEDEPVGINDFYVRYYTVQLLTLLLQVCAYKLQDAILSSPMGVVRLMDMLTEREVIRNEALQLLVALTRANEEVQKIAAFEGAFDRIFNMLREEGGADGGMVVQDCLELLNNLLRGNQANQRLFREMGFISQLPRLFINALASSSSNAAGVVGEADGGAAAEGLAAAALSAAAAAASAAVHTAQGLTLQGSTTVHISRQKAAILLCSLESVMLLVAAPESTHTNSAPSAIPVAPGNVPGPEATSRAATHNALLQAGVIEALLPLCLSMGGVSSQAVRVQALRALGDVVSGHQPSQTRLATSQVLTRSPPSTPAATLLARATAVGPAPPPTPLPALQALLRTCLHAADGSERAAAEHVLHTYCVGNASGQVELVCSMGPATGAGESGTFGSELAAALAVTGSGVTGLQVSCRAAAILRHLLSDNADAKQRLLTLPLELPSSASAHTELLMPRCIRHMLEALRVGGETGQVAACFLLRLLVVWLLDCPQAVRALLDTASHLPLLVDLSMGRHPEAGVEVSGLSALLLGECLLYGPTAPTPPPPGRPGPPPPSPHALILDVILSRVGLSHFFSRLDDLLVCKRFTAASVPPKMPKAITRAAAAAATAGEDGEGAESSDAHAGAGPDPASSPLNQLDEPFDYDFTVLAKEQAEAIKQAAMAAFSKPSSGQANNNSMAHYSYEDALANMRDASEQQKLSAAIEALRKLEAEAADLRSRNRALAEDLMRMASGGGASAGSVPPQPNGNNPSAISQAAASQAAAAVAAASAAAEAEAEKRLAAERRASNAEAEAAHYKQQVDVLVARMQSAERDANSAREAAANAYSAAAKHEADLQDLSSAYNSLEAHAHQLDLQVRDLTARLKAASDAAAAAHGGGGIMEEEVQARVRAAVEEAQTAAAAQMEGMRSAGGGGVSEEEVQRRVAAAVAEAKDEKGGEDEGEDGEDPLTDLLVCLGQEEQKVALLREHLSAYGVDVDALLATIKKDDEGEEDDDGLT